MAWAVTIDCDGVNNSKILWAEFIMNVDGTLTPKNGGEYVYDPYPGAANVWLPVLAYDINGTLALQYSVTSSVQFISNEINYRLSSYPVGMWDAQTSIVTGPNTYNIAAYERGSLSVFGTQLNRTFLNVQFITAVQSAFDLALIRNETFTRTYNATDNCGYSASCTQQINLS